LSFYSEHRDEDDDDEEDDNKSNDGDGPDATAADKEEDEVSATQTKQHGSVQHIQLELQLLDAVLFYLMCHVHVHDRRMIWMLTSRPQQMLTLN